MNGYLITAYGRANAIIEMVESTRILKSNFDAGTMAAIIKQAELLKLNITNAEKESQ